MKTLLMSLAALALPAAALAQPADPASPASFAPVDPQRLSEWTRQLASDQLTGRAPGTEGETRTVAWLIGQFRALGLQPGGANGSWTQTVPLIRTRVPERGEFTIRFPDGERLTLRSPADIYVSTVRDVPVVRIEDAPMVFVGYGVTAPERGWDDFGAVDLRGKIAVFLVNDPDFEAVAGDQVAGRFGGRAMTYYGRWTYKFEEAARRGAIGALVIHETEGAGYGWNTVQAPAGENYAIRLAAGARQPVLLQGWLQRQVAVDLFRTEGLDFEAVKRQARVAGFRPIELGATFSTSLITQVQHVESRNVIARLPGARRPNETIMFSGHWDAYGAGPADANGDTIAIRKRAEERYITKGFVKSFDDYAADLEQLFEAVLLPDCRAPYYILAHSAGALTALLAAPALSNRIRRMVLLAPLLDITGSRARKMAARFAANTLRSTGLGKTYMLGGPFEIRPFAANEVTSDAPRYSRNCEILQQAPELAVGGPTASWIVAAAAAIKKVSRPDFIETIRIPMLIIAAGMDSVVSTPAIERYALQLRNATLLTVDGAKHEILQEKNFYREQFFAAFDAFIPGTGGEALEMELSD